MPAAARRTTNKRSGKRRHKSSRSAMPAEFCAEARTALKRGTPDAISDKALQ